MNLYHLQWRFIVWSSKKAADRNATHLLVGIWFSSSLPIHSMHLLVDDKAFACRFIACLHSEYSICECQDALAYCEQPSLLSFLQYSLQVQYRCFALRKNYGPASVFWGHWSHLTIACRITFTPTVQHCSMATVIGLCLRLKLMQNFPSHFKVLSLFFYSWSYD
jgi:hypothetical protein